MASAPTPQGAWEFWSWCEPVAAGAARSIALMHNAPSQADTFSASTVAMALCHLAHFVRRASEHGAADGSFTPLSEWQSRTCARRTGKQADTA